jgi:hypothetical protein
MKRHGHFSFQGDLRFILQEYPGIFEQELPYPVILPSSKLLQEECGKRLFCFETPLSSGGTSHVAVVFSAFSRSVVDSAINSRHSRFGMF